MSGQSPRLLVQKPFKVQSPPQRHTREIPRQYVTIELAADPRATAGIPRRRASSTMSHTSRKYGARCSFSMTSSSCVSRESTPDAGACNTFARLQSSASTNTKTLIRHPACRTLEKWFFQFQFQFAAVRDLHRRVQQFRMIRKQPLHLRKRFEPCLARRDFRGATVVNNPPVRIAFTAR